MPATKIVAGVGGGDDVCADAGPQEECVYTKGTAYQGAQYSVAYLEVDSRRLNAGRESCGGRAVGGHCPFKPPRLESGRSRKYK